MKKDLLLLGLALSILFQGCSSPAYTGPRTSMILEVDFMDWLDSQLRREDANTAKLIGDFRSDRQSGPAWTSFERALSNNPIREQMHLYFPLQPLEGVEPDAAIATLKEHWLSMVEGDFQVIERRLGKRPGYRGELKRMDIPERATLEFNAIDAHGEEDARQLVCPYRLEFYETHNYEVAVQWTNCIDEASKADSSHGPSFYRLMKYDPGALGEYPGNGLGDRGEGIPFLGECDEGTREKVTQVIAKYSTEVCKAKDVKWSWEKQVLETGETTTRYRLLCLRTINEGPAMDGRFITKAEVIEDGNFGPRVLVSMVEEGAKKWEELTSRNLRRQIAIVVDGEILSAPVVETAIPGGLFEISGAFTLLEAEALAAALDGGALPLRVRVLGLN